MGVRITAIPSLWKTWSMVAACLAALAGDRCGERNVGSSGHGRKSD
jgi:hypothetical protein